MVLYDTCDFQTFRERRSLGAPLGAALKNVGALDERRSSNFQGAQHRAPLSRSIEHRKERKIERRVLQNWFFFIIWEISL